MTSIDELHAKILVYLKNPKTIDKVLKKFKSDLSDTQITNFIKGNLDKRIVKDTKERYKSVPEFAFEAERHLKSLEPKKTYWKTATIIVSLIAITLPSSITIYYNNLSEDIKTLHEDKINLSQELKILQSQNKLLADSIHSISISKDSLNTP